MVVAKLAIPNTANQTSAGFGAGPTASQTRSFCYTVASSEFRSLGAVHGGSGGAMALSRDRACGGLCGGRCWKVLRVCMCLDATLDCFSRTMGRMRGRNLLRCLRLGLLLSAAAAERQCAGSLLVLLGREESVERQIVARRTGGGGTHAVEWGGGGRVRELEKQQRTMTHEHKRTRGESDRHRCARSLHTVAFTRTHTHAHHSECVNRALCKIHARALTTGVLCSSKGDIQVGVGWGGGGGGMRGTGGGFVVGHPCFASPSGTSHSGGDSVSE